MRKKTLIHFSIFLPLTLLFSGLSVFGFVKTNAYSEEIEALNQEIKDLSSIPVPLKRIVSSNNSIINNDSKIYYCQNCEEFYDIGYHEYEYEGITYINACQTCSDFENRVIFQFEDSADKKNELRAQNASLLEQIAACDAETEAALARQEDVSVKLSKNMSLSIIATPIAIVLLLILVFARKD